MVKLNQKFVECERIAVEDQDEPVLYPLDDVRFLLTVREVRQLIRLRRSGLKLKIPRDVDTEGLQVSISIDEKPDPAYMPAHAVYGVSWQVDGTDEQRAAVAHAVHDFMHELNPSFARAIDLYDTPELVTNIEPGDC